MNFCHDIELRSTTNFPFCRLDTHKPSSNQFGESARIFTDSYKLFGQNVNSTCVPFVRIERFPQMDIALGFYFYYLQLIDSFGRVKIWIE